MRIDGHRGIAPIRNVQESTLRPLEETSAVRGDSLSLSSKAADFRVAMEALQQAPDIREAEVETLRQQIAEGTFQPDFDALAAKLLP